MLSFSGTETPKREMFMPKRVDRALKQKEFKSPLITKRSKSLVFRIFVSTARRASAGRQNFSPSETCPNGEFN
jgi:hypothetical protein